MSVELMAQTVLDNENDMKTKTIFALIGLFVILACTSIQKDHKVDYFEGKITYQNHYIIKTNKVDSAYLNKYFGKTAKLSFKEGNYLETYDGGSMLEQLYIKKDNRTYIKKNQSDTLYWFDCNTPSDKIIKSEVNHKKEIILGIECDELITYYANKTVSFYYNSDSLKINPDWYKNFTTSNKNLNSLKMKSVYLKYKIEYADFIATVTAISIKKEKLNDNLFSIPKNKILVEDK